METALSDAAEKPDVWEACRELCVPEVFAALERVQHDSEYKTMIAVLQQCQRINRMGFRMVLAELNNCRNNSAALGSLLNEVRSYADERYRDEVAKYLAGECNEPNLTYGVRLARWLEQYQFWCRAIT